MTLALCFLISGGLTIILALIQWFSRIHSVCVALMWILIAANFFLLTTVLTATFSIDQLMPLAEMPINMEGVKTMSLQDMMMIVSLLCATISFYCIYKMMANTHQ